jgi:hypothetical protein
MKNIVLSLVFFASVYCFSQNSSKTYSNIYLSESMDAHFSKHYKKYVANYFYKTTGKKRIIERDSVLDIVAFGRSEYSVLVFKESSKQCSFKSLLAKVPDGEAAHKRFYSNPAIFKEPKGCVFPDKDNLPILKRNNLIWNSELFIQDFYSHKSENSNIPDADIIEKYSNFMRKNEDPSKEDNFLNGYLNSPAHKNSIQKYGNWKFGCSTMLIVSKQYDKSTKMWKYEVFACHTIIIVRNKTDSNVY